MQSARAEDSTKPSNTDSEAFVANSDSSISYAVHPKVLSTATAFPPYEATQDEIVAGLKAYWNADHLNVSRLETLHRSAQVQHRYLACPIDEYPKLDTFQKRNDRWITVATDLAVEVAEKALRQANLTAADIDHLFFVTITGMATPSIDARMAHRMGFRPDIKRSPIFGLGCVAGAAGIARAADYLRGFPGQRAMLVSVELCSLTLQQNDTSIVNIVATGLFGDGAAAVILGAPPVQTPGRTPEIVASTSVLYPDSERVMGWDFVDTGFKIVLSSEVPELARKYIGPDVDRFLGTHGLSRRDLSHWVIHTGGPKVLEAIQESLSLPESALTRSWHSLRTLGNLSSSSVLSVLHAFQEEKVANAGDRGLLLAMGPGFCSEMSLLRW